MESKTCVVLVLLGLFACSIGAPQASLSAKNRSHTKANTTPLLKTPSPPTHSIGSSSLSYEADQKSIHSDTSTLSEVDKNVSPNVTSAPTTTTQDHNHTTTNHTTPTPHSNVTSTHHATNATTTPHSSMTTPHSNMTTHHSNITTPHSNMTTPHSNMTTPHSNMTTPIGNSTTPHSTPITPGTTKHTTKKPSSDSSKSFDVGSFFGGIGLAVGVVIIVLIGVHCYRKQKTNSYSAM